MNLSSSAKPRLCARLLSAVTLGLTFLPALAFDDSRTGKVIYPSWFKQSFLDLTDDLNEARAGGKKGLMIYFSSQGCSYCVRFNELSLGDASLAALVQKHFDTIGLDVFDDAEMVDTGGKPLRVKHFAKKERAWFTPTLLFLDSDGKRVLRVVGYHSPQRFRRILEYVIGEHYRALSLRDYLKRAEDMPAATQALSRLRHDPIFRGPPYDLRGARAVAPKPLMVVFEKSACEECETFHNAVLNQDEVRSLLRRFDAFQLNADDNGTKVVMPSGEETTAAQWFERTGFTRVPSFLFFEPGGQQVLQTDALVLKLRMINSLLFMLERAYEKGWTYQRFARSRGIERYQQSLGQ